MNTEKKKPLFDKFDALAVFKDLYDEDPAKFEGYKKLFRVRKWLVPPHGLFTPHDLKRLADKELVKLVKRLELVGKPSDVYNYTDELDAFRFNIEKTKLLSKTTYEAYYYLTVELDIDPDKAKELEIKIDDVFNIYLPIFYEQLLVQVVSIIEAYLDDILRYIYNKELGRKSFIKESKSMDKRMSYKKILDFKSLEELHQLIVEETIGEYQRWDERIKFFNDRKKLNIKFDESGFKVKDLKKLTARRNIIIHRKGIVDQKYLADTKDKTYKIGDEIKIDQGYISNTLDGIEKLAEFIDKKVIEEYY